MAYLIGITGLAMSGKDTAAWMLRTHGYQQAAFADPLKKMASIFCDEPLDLFHTVDGKAQTCDLHGKSRREILQLLGTECVKPWFGEGVWVRHMFSRINSGALGDRVVISDVRFEPEADAILDAGGYLIQMVRGPGLQGAEAAHRSEAGINPDKVDFVVHNDSSLVALKSEITKIADYIERKERAR